jgi:nicotinamidase-related amidase
MEKRTLVIVDLQNDFCNPKGSLYVNGAEEAKANIIKYLEANKDNIDNVILTRDWHRVDDKSFAENGGTWPVHCLQGNWGADVDGAILSALNDLHLNYVYSNKGTNPDVEEYGAFSFIQETDNGFALQNVNDSYETIIPKNATNVKVCGIAGDYCVLETSKNLVESGYFNVSLILDAIASIDGGEAITNYSNTISKVD